MPEAPGRAWFDRFQQAFLDHDLETIWALQTRASHALMLLRMQQALDRAGTDAEYRRLLKERMGSDITGLDPKAAWEAYTLASCAHIAAGHMRWEYVGEESDAERVLLRLEPVGGSRPLPAGMGQLVQVLLEEDGELRLDKPATEELLEA